MTYLHPLVSAAAWTTVALIGVVAVSWVLREKE